MIFSFYSYKGGAGRTQLLVNLATYLCYYMDKRVLILDWDMEAPGVNFFFGYEYQDIDKRGLVEVFEDYCKCAQRERTNFLPKEQYPDLYVSEENIFNLRQNTSGGKIDLIPAGNYKEGHFFKSVASFDWYRFTEILGGRDYIEDFKNNLKELKYDFVFVDSRTGINGYTNTVNIQMSDCDVLVMVPNEQNFAGCKVMADRILSSPYVQAGRRKNHILPILSRFVEDTSHEERNKWLARFVEDFSYLLPTFADCESLNEEEQKKLFEDTYLVGTKLNQIKFMGESIFFKEGKEEVKKSDTLVYNISNIAKYLDNIKETGYIDIENPKTPKIQDKAAIQSKADAYFNMGASKYFLNEFEEAVQNYDKAIELDPNNALYYLERGRAFYEWGKAQEAVKSLDNALMLATQRGDSAIAHKISTLMGDAYMLMGDAEQAVLRYKESTERTKQPEASLWYKLALAEAQTEAGKTGGFLQYLRRAIQKDKQLKEQALGEDIFKPWLSEINKMPY